VASVRKAPALSNVGDGPIAIGHLGSGACQSAYAHDLTDRLTGGTEHAVDGADRHPMSRRESRRRDRAVEQMTIDVPLKLRPQRGPHALGRADVAAAAQRADEQLQRRHAGSTHRG
jgi:hypothetical protein